MTNHTRKLTGSSLFILALIGIAFSQKQVSDSSLKSLILSEQAFSKMAELQGTREAFAAFIADDGILFRPTAVNGKQWLQQHPLPAATKHPLLSWQPTFADVSRAGDLGYTTGPWQYKDDIKDQKPSAFGDFMTVWKRQPDGLWKFVLDLGISHPTSSGPLNVWSVAKLPTLVQKPFNNPASEASLANLLARDHEFTDKAVTLGVEQAFASYSSQTVRLFKDGTLPFVGKKATVSALTARQEKLTWKPEGNGVSASDDLGYLYGTYEATSIVTKKVSEHGNFLRIWKKQGQRWRIVVEVDSRLPG